MNRKLGHQSSNRPDREGFLPNCRGITDFDGKVIYLPAGGNPLQKKPFCNAELR
jgi:hypothetical protein